MDLSVTFAGLRLEHPIMNAAGTAKLVEHVQRLARSAVSAIVVGSITVEARAGNTGDVFYHDGTFSLNSLGLPNPGRAYYERELPGMARIVHGEGKLLIVSVAGFSPEEYGILTEIAKNGGADAVEENLGCPNVWKDGKQKRIASFDLNLVMEIRRKIFQRVGSHRPPIGLKLSPFSDPFLLEEFCKLFDGPDADDVQFFTVCNTFPNAQAFDAHGKARITPGEGLAGFAGPAFKPIVLGQVCQYHKVLPPGIVIAAAGGIQHGRDVMDYKQAGATAMQINTAYSDWEDVGIFSRILSEYVDLQEARSAALPL